MKSPECMGADPCASLRRWYNFLLIKMGGTVNTVVKLWILPTILAILSSVIHLFACVGRGGGWYRSV